MTTADSPPTDRTRIRRIKERGIYDRTVLYRIIDAAWHCHMAFVDESGTHCIPMACWRDADALYIHGSNGARLLKVLVAGAQVCVTITHLDGLVVARSAFHHSMNYRSAVIYGQCERVRDEDKSAALDRFLQRIAPGREREVRSPNEKELAATTILRLPLMEAAAKVREGGPKDDPADMGLPVWAGVLPVRLQPLSAQVDADCAVDPPAYVREWKNRSIDSG